VAANFEYWTAVFGVGLDGFSDYDHDELNAIAEQGWEPIQIAAVHNGFAAIVMFRRELDPAPAPARVARPAGGAAKKSAKKATKSTKSAAGRAAR